MRPNSLGHVQRGRLGAPGQADSCRSPRDSLQPPLPHPTSELALSRTRVGARRTHNSPEVVTRPRKWGKANGGLKQQGMG